MLACMCVWGGGSKLAKFGKDYADTVIISTWPETNRPLHGQMVNKQDLGLDLLTTGHFEAVDLLNSGSHL